MKVLWLPSPAVHSMSAAQPALAHSSASHSLLSLCLSIYSAGRVRKSTKRLAKNELAASKNGILEEVGSLTRFRDAA